MERSKEEEDACSDFTASSFYGNSGQSGSDPRNARLQEILANVEKCAEYIDQHPLPSTYNPGILGPSATWEVFRRQLEAITYAQLVQNGLMVFAFEGEAVGSGGKRNFVVTHPEQMWLRQSERLPEKRCMYEVIKEESPCKLYFDLEFLYATNPNKNGVAMTNTFIRIICYFLDKEFNISCSRKDIIDLRGTCDLKFSRHLIFNIPGIAFAANGHVGAFVRMVCGKLRQCKDGRETVEVPNVSSQDVKDLFVLDSKGAEALFCDEGVYSKNRNFRLYLSTKMGQNSPLVIGEENEYYPDEKSTNGKEKQLFLDSLITLVDDNCKVLRYQDKEQEAREAKPNSSRRSADVDGSKRSPYPEIDDFIESLIGPGSIHSWHYFSNTETLVYNIVRYRYCHNINREHKSNNIMYVVNLKETSYYQKCHDHDCRNFKSETWPLPREIVFWQDMDEEEMKEWMHCVGESDSGGIVNESSDESRSEEEKMTKEEEDGSNGNVNELNAGNQSKEKMMESVEEDSSRNVNESSNRVQSEGEKVLSKEKDGSSRSVNESNMIMTEKEMGTQVYDDPMEKWEHIEDIVTSQGTSSSIKSFGSQCLWDGLSQLSSPNAASVEALSQPWSQDTSSSIRPFGSQCLWDGLSQLSSPNTSSLEALSQPWSQGTSGESRDQDKDIANSCSLSDEELLRAVTYIEETMLCGDQEMELTC